MKIKVKTLQNLNKKELGIVICYLNKIPRKSGVWMDFKSLNSTDIPMVL